MIMHSLSWHTCEYSEVCQNLNHNHAFSNHFLICLCLQLTFYVFVSDYLQYAPNVGSLP